MSELRDDLTKVRGLLAKGWTQGAFYDSKTDCYCLLGAIERVSGSLYTDSFKALIEAVEREIPRIPSLSQHLSLIVFFNDDSGRTKAEVLNLLDKAIEGVA